jgi:putative nucleotidyltransferase with HDIG domain
MQKIQVSSLKPGIKLGKNIFSKDFQLLLSAGTIIKQEDIDNLLLRDINEIYIAESSPRLDGKQKFEDVYYNSLDVVKSFMMGAKLGKTLEIDQIEDTVTLLLKQVFDATDLFRQIRLMKQKDDYLFTHSVNVSLLCILIGRWLRCDADTIRELGMAGLLHDIGKVYIDNETLNKPGKLTEKEFEEIKKHTLWGYNLLSQNEWVSRDVANAALMHHERADGSGYPAGTKGYTNFYASAVAVADIFDAITSEHSYSGKRSLYTAAEILWQESFGKLDPRITKVFYDRISSFYVGNKVLLSNGEEGIVIYINPTQPTKPMIKAGDKFYNLATDMSITIKEVID